MQCSLDLEGGFAHGHGLGVRAQVPTHRIGRLASGEAMRRVPDMMEGGDGNKSWTGGVEKKKQSISHQRGMTWARRPKYSKPPECVLRASVLDARYMELASGCRCTDGVDDPADAMRGILDGAESMTAATAGWVHRIMGL